MKYMAASRKSQVASPKETTTVSFTKAEQIYKHPDGGDLTMHIYAPESPGSARAAIVFFFGGGWQGGNPKQFFPHCEHLASRGMVACSAQYRVKSTHGVSPAECVVDGKSAVRWLRSHASELGVDPARVAAGGGSAGGHVAACTGVVEGFDAPGEDETIRSRPDALVLFNPVLDIASHEQWHERFGEHFEALSPLQHARPGLPPCIVFHGTGDTTVPFADVERFRDRMLEAGNECEVVGFEGKPHGFFNYGRFDNKPYKESVRAMDRFLVKHGFLAGAASL